jgi:chitodextrinase
MSGQVVAANFPLEVINTVLAYGAIGVRAADTAGIAAAMLADTTAPSVPGSLAVSMVSGARVDLSWSASSDNVGVVGYRIYRDGVETGTSTGVSYTDSTALPATSYTYNVAAYDAAGNYSAQTPALNVATGREYYVSPDGDNSTPPEDNNINHPWLTIEHGVYNVHAGDVLYIRGGVYTPAYPIRTRSDYDRKTYGGNPDEKVNCTSGTEQAPVVIVNYDDEKVVVDCGLLDVFVHLDNKSHWHWKGLAFINAGIVFNVGQNSQTSHNVFESLNIRMVKGGDNWGGIKLINGNSEYTTIRNCEIIGPGPASSGIHANTACIYLRIINNVLIVNNNLSNAPFAIYYKHANTQGTFAERSNIEIAYNYVFDTDRQSIFLNCNRAYIHNNLFDINNASFAVNEANGKPGGDYNIIEHNTFMQGISLSHYTQNGDLVPGAIGNVLRNNIILGCSNIHNYSSVPHNTIMDYNLYPHSYVINENKTKYTFEAWQLYYGQDKHSLSGTPAFIDGAAPSTIAGFALTDGSPGKSAASNGKDMGADVTRVGIQTLGPTDTTAPSVPASLAGKAVSSTAINLTWDASTDNVGVTGYRINRDGSQVGTADSTSYTDTGLTAATSYSYTVAAFDAAGNLSATSAAVSVSTADEKQEILWRDNFEAGASLGSKYEDVGTSGLSVSDVSPFNGAGVLQQAYTNGQVGAGWVIKYRSGGFPDRIFMRWYHRFDAGFQGFPPKMARIRYRNHSTWTSPMEVHCWIESDGVVALDVKASDSTQANSDGWLPVARSSFTYANSTNLGRWVCFEMEVQLNTVGQTDGAYRLWIDNDLAVERTGVDLRGSQSYSINECMLDCFWNGGSPRAQSRFYDAFVISTRKIGPEVLSDSYRAWRAVHFTRSEQADETVSGPLADPDGFGLTNLERYGFDLPARGAARPVYELSWMNDGGISRPALTFQRRGYAPDLEYMVQSSADLMTWENLPAILPGYPKTVTVQDPFAPTNAPCRFLRLRIRHHATTGE